MSKPLRFGHLFLLALVWSCSEDTRVAGNNTSTGNAQATGRILSSTGSAVAGVWVECAPDSSLPWSTRQAGWSDLTDSTGRYRCTDLPMGRVGISAFDPGSGLSRWRDDTLRFTSESDHVDTLAPSGILKVALPPGTNGILHFTGLTRTVSVRGETRLVIDGLPAGWMGSLKIALASDRSSLIDSGLRVAAGGSDSAGYNRQAYRIRVDLAGGLTSSVTQLPVLVRLDSSWPGFANSHPDGSDLRLSSTAGKALPITVASWDREAKSGSIWTLLDTLHAPGSSVDLVLESGLPAPTNSVASAFPASGGFVAVWPMGDTGSSVLDRLGKSSGTPTSLSTTAGIAGKASRFNGSSSKVVFAGSSSGTLALSEGGPYTMSCWARLKAYTSSRLVMGHGQQGSHINFQANYGADTNSWLVNEFRSSPGGAFYRLGHADTAVWTHLAMTVDADSVFLYIDGIRQSGSRGFDQGTKVEVDFAIGASLDSNGVASRFFNGDLAEVWVHKVVRSPDWVRFAAANQSPTAARAKMIP